MTELLKCPFCGSNPHPPKREGGSDERYGYNFTMVIECSGCGIRKGAGSAQDKNGWCNDSGQARASVIEKWNARTPI